MPQQPFEPTNSWCYRFARYEAIPEILAMPAVTSGDPFKLIELTRQVIDRHLTPEQQHATFRTTQANREVSIGASIRWYVPFIAKNTNQLFPLGGGIFRLPQSDDVDEDELESEAIDAASDEADVAVDLSGWLYAFSFQLIMSPPSGPYPIKIGKTVVDVQQRVIKQCKQSAIFAPPVILREWQVKHVGAAELAVHNALRYRGKWREDAPGTEWFDTTVEEIDSIVAFLDKF